VNVKIYVGGGKNVPVITAGLSILGNGISDGKLKVNDFGKIGRESSSDWRALLARQRYRT